MKNSLESLLAAARAALESGSAAKARELAIKAVERYPAATENALWKQILDPTNWPDSWLIASVRCEPPDEQALEALASRYWGRLYARCEALSKNGQRANDLAQETWRRILRARGGLRSDGNFFAYLNTTATNLWRDRLRSLRRAGSLAEYHLASLDAPIPDAEGETARLGDCVADARSLSEEHLRLLKIDIDSALSRLTPLLRDVLVSRFIQGESCAEIGRRYGRTEQTVSARVREGARLMKEHLGEQAAVPAQF